MFDLTNTTKIDYAGEVAARLNKDYARLFETVSDILARMAKLPKVIENEAHLSAYGSIMSEARETKKRLEAYHEAEKAPYLGGGRGVDNTFFSQVSKLARRKDGEPAGALDICDARVDNYMQAKLMEEQLKREAEAREAARVQRELEEAAAAAAAAAAEREAAAARARKPENIEAHKEAAYEHAEAAAKLEFQADHAAEVADDARIDTLATPADMTRTRLAGGQRRARRRRLRRCVAAQRPACCRCPPSERVCRRHTFSAIVRTPVWRYAPLAAMRAARAASYSAFLHALYAAKKGAHALLSA